MSETLHVGEVFKIGRRSDKYGVQNSSLWRKKKPLANENASAAGENKTNYSQ